METATAANLRGVGLMEQHQFPEAEKEFAEAVRAAPEWLPARVNLGIAKFNQQPSDSKARTRQTDEAKAIFRDVLKTDPNNLHAHYCLGVLADYFGERAEAYERFALVSKADPDDAHTWLMVGRNHPDGADSDAAPRLFRAGVENRPVSKGSPLPPRYADPPDRSGSPESVPGGNRGAAQDRPLHPVGHPVHGDGEVRGGDRQQPAAHR